MAAKEPASRKRKRQEQAEDEETTELEIDLSRPEPLSRKAQRHAKKDKTSQTRGSKVQVPHGKLVPEAGGLGVVVSSEAIAKPRTDSDGIAKAENEAQSKSTRSEYGIWIGNLPWSVTKQDMREFLCRHGKLSDHEITRIHMPGPSTKTKTAAAERNKPRNKGFAYIDLAGPAQLASALGLTEQLMLGRRVLIKDFKSFHGRPDSQTKPQGSPTKPASRRVFIGNLGFDVTTDQLYDHFGQCGQVLDVHMATFEDSGKCKGFAWITFATVDEASKAVNGYYLVSDHDVNEPGGPQVVDRDQQAKETGEVAEGEHDGSTGPPDCSPTNNAAEQDTKTSKQRSKKQAKTRKKYVNRFFGRTIRAEFAEDKAIRYQKRFANSRPLSAAAGLDPETMPTSSATTITTSTEPNPAPIPTTAHERRKRKRQADDAVRPRHVHRPHAENSLTVPAKHSGAIVPSLASKITFD